MLISIYPFVDYPYGVNFQIIRQPLLPLDNQKIFKNQFSTRIALRHVNIWSRQQNYYIIDGEESQAELSTRYGITDKLSFGFAISHISQGGGFFDSTVEGFHRMTGVTQGGRDNYPQNKMNVSYEPFGKYYGIIDNNPLKTYLRQYDTRTYPRDENSPPISLDEFTRSSFKDSILYQRPDLAYFDKTEIIALKSQDRNGSGNPRIFLEYEIPYKSFFDKIKIGFQYKFPIPNSFLISSPGYDRSIFFVFGKNLGNAWIFKLGYSHILFGETNYLSFNLPKRRNVLRNSLEYFWKPDLKLFFEYVITEAPFQNFGRLGKPTHQISFGYKYNFSDKELVMGIAEDIINFSTSPDIGIFISLESKF